MARKIVIDEATADVLRASTINGNALTLPPAQLDRVVYVSVNKALEALGGKWNRKLRAHVFPGPVGDALATILDAGEVVPPSAFGYFPTPAPLVARLLELACVEPHHVVLEPSAGQGAIADALASIVRPDRLRLVELQADNCRVLRSKGYDPIEGDFLAAVLPAVDRVVMNPPFERKQDVEHVTHAFGLLKPGGRLVSVMAAGAQHNSDQKTAAFREVVETHGWAEPNPPGSFKGSGTGVNTVTVVLDKAEELRDAA